MMPYCTSYFKFLSAWFWGVPEQNKDLAITTYGRGDPSLIRYSSKTTEQNFMKLSGIVHYMMSYCTSYFKFLSAWFWVSQSKTRILPYKTWGSGGYHFVSIAHSISSFVLNRCKIILCDKTHPKTRKRFYNFLYKKNEFYKCYLLITFIPMDKNSRNF